MKVWTIFSSILTPVPPPYSTARFRTKLLKAVQDLYGEMCEAGLSHDEAIHLLYVEFKEMATDYENRLPPTELGDILRIRVRA